MIEICEVGPRDGLQNEKKHWSVKDRVSLIERLIKTGVKKIEAVSFVNPKIVPQMAYAKEVMENLPRDNGVSYSGLVLNPRGLDEALECNLTEINIVLSASSTFNLKNVRKTTDESISQLAPLVVKAKENHLRVNCTIGNTFGCPYEGEVSFSKVLEVADAFVENGIDQITLADTTGMANPKQVSRYVGKFNAIFPNIKLALHFHNTRGLGLTNVFAGYQAGVRSFDSSIGGLGGCPFAPLAAGNVCTEDLIHLFEQMGIQTGIDLKELIETAKWVESKIDHGLDGLVLKAGPVNS